MNDPRPLVIYHGACRDGFCAAWVAWSYFKDKGGADFFEGFYGQEPPIEMAQKASAVYLLDFSYPLQQMESLLMAARLHVLEHHKTAEAPLSTLRDFAEFRGLTAEVVFDINRSGAGISWDYWFGKSWAEYEGLRPWCVDYVEDRDIWRWALPDSRAINAYLGAVPFDFEEWSRLTSIPKMAAKAAGDAVQLKVGQYAAEVGKNAIRISFEGHDGVPIVNAPQCDISELLESLIDTTGSPISMGWWQRADGIFQYSLRSRGDLDVSALAKLHGGGGHKNAAGFQSAKRLEIT